MDKSTQSLAKATPMTIEAAPQAITDTRIYQQQIEDLCTRFNVIAPPVQVLGGFAPGYALIASVVKVNAKVNEDGQGAETYYDRGFMKSKDQRALNRVGLARVATAAGVKWTPNCGRRDDGKTPNFWEYYAEGLVDTPDGSYQVVTGSVEIDLRDGSAQIGGWTPEQWAAVMKENERKSRDEKVWNINGWSDKRVQQARSRGHALAETKAKNRAVRSLGLQQVYTETELDKPFVIFRATYQPDMSDPVVRQMVAQRALHGRQMLYPSSAAVTAQPFIAAPQAPAGTIDTTATSSAAASVEPTSTEPTVTITSVKDIGTIASSGEVVSEITFSDGRTARTGNADLVNAARKHQIAKIPVEFVLEPSERVKNVMVLIELTPMRSAEADLY